MTTPDELPGLVQWLAADTLELDDSDPVATWPATVGNDAAQATSELRPVYRTGIVGPNARPVVRFDGSRWLSFAGLGDTLSTYTVFAVARTNTAGPGTILSQDAAGFSNDLLFGVHPETDITTPNRWAAVLQRSSGSVRRIVTDPTDVDYDTWAILVVRYDGELLQLFVDDPDTPVDTAATTTGLVVADRTWNVGRNPQGGVSARIFNGDIAELGIYDEALDDEDLADLIQGLHDKYFVFTPIGPGVLTPPTLGDLGRIGDGPTIGTLVLRRWQIAASLDGYGPLPLSFARRWWEQTNDTGIGELTLDNTDPAAQAVQLGDLIRFSVDDQPRFCARVESIEPDTINEGEEIRQITRVSGRGLLAEWDRAIVRPPGALGQRPFADLLIFNWAHPEIDIELWPTAFVQWVQGIGAPGYPSATGLAAKVNSPLGFPDPDACWIWPAPPVGVTPAQPPGVGYFAGELFVAAATPISIYVAGDDSFELWLDGIPVGANRELNGWRETFRADTTLSPGWHRFAARCENFERENAATNVAGFIISIWSQDGDGNDDEVLLRSNFLWRALLTDEPPGFTDGQIIRLLLESAQSQGELTGWTLSFTDTTDTNGDPWPVRTETTFRGGISLLAALRQLGETNIEFAADPNTRILHAWLPGGRGNSAPQATLAAGTNLIRLTHKERG